MSKIGFVGVGVMGSALLSGIVKEKIVKPEDIIIFDKIPEKASKLNKKLGVNVAADISEVCSFSEYIFLCVKPDIIDIVVKDLNNCIKEKTVIISIAAGVKIDRIKNSFSKDIDVIRTMPNTSALVKESVTLVCADDIKDEVKLDQVITLFKSIGQVHILPETLMSEATALTGSGPAYVYIFIEAMAKAADGMGISKDIAISLAAQTVLGSAKMVLETMESPIKLKNNVCSPGGTTIEAMKVFEERGFEGIIIDAIKACAEKAYKLGGETKKIL